MLNNYNGFSAATNKDFFMPRYSDINFGNISNLCYSKHIFKILQGSWWLPREQNLILYFNRIVSNSNIQGKQTLSTKWNDFCFYFLRAHTFFSLPALAFVLTVQVRNTRPLGSSNLKKRKKKKNKMKRIRDVIQVNSITNCSHEKTLKKKTNIHTRG